jgi:hypothetical protein
LYHICVVRSQSVDERLSIEYKEQKPGVWAGKIIWEDLNMKKTIALILATMMMLCLCAACGGDTTETAAEPVTQAEAAAPAAEEAAPAEEAAAAPEAPAEGDASGEPSGEAAPTPDFYAPTDAYAKDFEGYRQYCIDAFATDPGAPEELKEQYNAEFAAMTDDTGTTVQALIDLGLICSYEDFLAY